MEEPLGFRLNRWEQNSYLLPDTQLPRKITEEQVNSIWIELIGTEPELQPASFLMRSARRPNASLTYSNTLGSAPCARRELLKLSTHPLTVMVELLETRPSWEAKAWASSVVAERYSEHQLNWEWRVETIDSFDPKYWRRIRLKDFNASVWISETDSSKIDPFLGASRLLHSIGWLVALGYPWWIFPKINDYLESHQIGWVGWLLSFLVLGNSFFLVFVYLVDRLNRRVRRA